MSMTHFKSFLLVGYIQTSITQAITCF